MSTIGIIGAGNIGSHVARQAIAAGHDVVISNSRSADTLADVVAQLGPRARAATAAEAAAAGEIAVVAIPLKNIANLAADGLAGKVVLDANNYYPQRDGVIEELENESTTTSELLQRHLPASKVVKAFNHIAATAIVDDARPSGAADRRALVIAGDDPDAKQVATAFIDQLGFDVVDAGPLAEGWRIQRDTPGYGPRLNASDMRAALAQAKRYSDQT